MSEATSRSGCLPHTQFIQKFRVSQYSNSGLSKILLNGGREEMSVPGADDVGLSVNRSRHNRVVIRVRGNDGSRNRGDINDETDIANRMQKLFDGGIIEAVDCADAMSGERARVLRAETPSR